MVVRAGKNALRAHEKSDRDRYSGQQWRDQLAARVASLLTYNRFNVRFCFAGYTSGYLLSKLLPTVPLTLQDTTSASILIIDCLVLRIFAERASSEADLYVTFLSLGLQSLLLVRPSTNPCRMVIALVRRSTIFNQKIAENFERFV